jgi:FkbM family methyltransferase
MNILRALRRPEYFFNPVQVCHRIWRAKYASLDMARLAWGLPIHVHLDCQMGFDILNLGMFDRIVPEAICRLLKPNEWALDVGANIGQNTSILALAAGKQGKVFAFEPHPRLAATLHRNRYSWSGYDLAPIEIIQKGLSSQEGTAHLYESDKFAYNLGSASLEQPAVVRQQYEISLTTLDAFLPTQAEIGVAKIDTEGHELEVLRGALTLLRQRRIRDIIYEDFSTPPSAVTRLLEEAGHTVFMLSAGWGKPYLTPYRELDRCRPKGLFLHNYLATLAPERASQQFQKSTWHCMRLRAAKR